MYKKAIVIIAVISMLTGVAFAASDNDDKDTSPVQSGWVEGTGPTAEIYPVIGGNTMVGTYWRTTGDAGTTPGTHFLGTTDNKAFEIKVNNQRVFRLEPNYYSPSVIAGYSTNNVASGVYGATIGGGGSYGTANENKVTTGGNYATISGGIGNTVSSEQGAIVGGMYNSVNGNKGFLGGGYSNQVDGNYSSIGGGYDNSTADVAGASVGGGYYNEANASQATVSGGYDNTASGSRSAIGGGRNNSATDNYTTVSGGYNNSAGNDYSAVGGGYSNDASGYTAVISGGFDNSATESSASVGGGCYNVAGASGATVPGGGYNEAEGMYSFAAGYRAKANHIGSFVWGDYQTSNITSTGSNEFIVRANGGIWFGNNSSPSTPSSRLINTSTGAYLSTGGTWTNASDRNLKEGFQPVNDAEILEKVAELPITTWNYREEDPSVTHIGPVAQDFHAAFGLGNDDRSISTVDANGVALIAIQALYKENQELKTQLQDQQEHLESLEARLEALEAGK